MGKICDVCLANVKSALNCSGSDEYLTAAYYTTEERKRKRINVYGENALALPERDSNVLLNDVYPNE